MFTLQIERKVQWRDICLPASFQKAHTNAALWLCESLFLPRAIFRRHKNASQQISHEYGWHAVLLNVVLSKKAATKTQTCLQVMRMRLSKILNKKSSITAIRRHILLVLFVQNAEWQQYIRKLSQKDYVIFSGFRFLTNPYN